MNGHREAERVEGEQDAAAADRRLLRRGGEDRAERGAGARQPRDREREPGDDRPAGVGAAHELLRAPVAVQLGHEQGGDEQHAEPRDDDAGDLAEQRAVVLQRLAEAGGGHAERHEHDREREAEQERRRRAPARAPLPSWMSANETPEMVDR